MRKIVEAEIMSEGKTPLRITLTNGEIIEGYSWGIMPEFDDDGEELDYDILAFKMYAPAGYCHLRDEDIEKVEKAS
jgi:hypothetical protein